jgi:hypothetical protein
MLWIVGSIFMLLAAAAPTIAATRISLLEPRAITGVLGRRGSRSMWDSGRDDVRGGKPPEEAAASSASASATACAASLVRRCIVEWVAEWPAQVVGRCEHVGGWVLERC